MLLAIFWASALLLAALLVWHEARARRSSTALRDVAQLTGGTHDDERVSSTLRGVTLSLTYDAGVVRVETTLESLHTLTIEPKHAPTQSTAPGRRFETRHRTYNQTFLMWSNDPTWARERLRGPVLSQHLARRNISITLRDARLELTTRTEPASQELVDVMEFARLCVEVLTPQTAPIP